MYSAVIFALATFAGLAVAAPQPQTTSVSVPPSGIFTNSSVSDGFPSKLKARGYHEDTCTECPPEPPTCDRYKGCLYIECSDDCEDEKCCECIGLEKEKPYVHKLPLGTSLTLISSCITTRIPLVIHPISKSIVIGNINNMISITMT